MAERSPTNGIGGLRERLGDPEDYSDDVRWIVELAYDLVAERDEKHRQFEDMHTWGSEWKERAYAAEAERDRLAAALKAIHANATAWHGNESVGTGAYRALEVIAGWAQHPESIPDGVARTVGTGPLLSEQPTVHLRTDGAT